MSLTGNNILGGASGQTTGYDIEQSLRANADDGYLTRTFGSVGNRKTWTLSAWVKKTRTDKPIYLLASNFDDTDNLLYIDIRSSNAVASKDCTGEVLWRLGSGTSYRMTTTQVFRDPSAWYHFVIACDTTQASATNRMKFYVNGEQVTSFATDERSTITQDSDLAISRADLHYIASWNAGEKGGGYLAEYHFIDGTALDASSFGETNEDTNQWQAIKYAGSYGTNGFYLKFQDSSALGDDSSGNTNDFSATNLVATDQVLDSPTNNFATLNGVFVSASGSGRESTLSEGNLKATTPTTGSGYNGPAMGTMGMSSGKWYFEWYIGSSNYPAVGIAKADYNTGYAQTNVGNRVWLDGGDLYGTGSSASGTTYTTGDIVGCAVDMDNGKMWFSKNGAFISSGDPAGGTNAQFTDLLSASDMGSTGQVLPFFSDVNWSTSDTVTFNAGQDSSFAGAKTAQGNQDGNGIGDFYYTPPSGFVALCADNLPDPSIADPTAHFDTTLVSGNGANRSITGLNFQPDFLWGKSRTNTLNHYLTDSVRGVNSQLYSDGTGSQGTETVIYTAFNSDGFSLGTGDMNTSGQNYVHWAWKGGGTASTNDDGSIDSSVSANTTAGFSIVKWTGSEASATIGHGLSQAPELIIVKDYDTTGRVWPVNVTNITGTANQYLILNATDAVADSAAYWGAAPGASTFTVGDSGTTNGSGSVLAYCFHSVEGYSKVGSYTGNGASSGPFIYTGFRPAFIMVKLVSATDGYWVMFDNKRDPDNPTGRVFYANLNAISTDVSSYAPYDLLSNGFKSRIPGGNGNEASYNSSGQTYIYLAFAESPFKTSNAW